MQLKAILIVDSAQSQSGRSGARPRLTALEHVANRPIVHHVLDSLRQAGVDELIVAGDADALVDVCPSLRDYQQGFRSVEYALGREDLDFQTTLTEVASLVGGAPCLIHPADGLLDSPVRTVAAALDAGAADLVLFVSEGARDGAERRDQSLDDLADQATRNGDRCADIALFGPGMLDRACETASPSGWGDLTTTVERLAAGAHVHVERVDGWRRYRGNGQDLLELNRVALDRLSASVPASVLETNRLEGRVRVDPTAVVRDSVIIGPAVIGAGATVNQAYIGPYISVGVGAQIEGTEIERSIVCAGARVIHVGGRLMSSLVGRDARVFRDFSLPRALRLWVGDGDEVALC